MAHVVSSPHSFLTAKQIGLENANARMVQGTFFGVNGYSNPIEKHEEDMPLDFSKKKDSMVKHLKEESHERQNAISERSAYSVNMRRSPSTIQHVKTNPKAVIESRNTSSPNRPCIPQIDSEFSENPVAYPNLSSAALMEHLAYVNAVNKYSTILPKLNVHMPQIGQQEQINNRRELSPICKMMENQSFDSGIISPVTATSATPHEFSQLSKNNSSSLDLLQNNLKFNNTTAFAPILLTPPPSNVAGSRAVQEPMTRTSHFPVLDEVSILQRTLTASSTQHQLDEYGNPHRGLKNKKARPFKSYNPLPKSFPTGLPTLPLGIMQDFEDQEYRYQQFMETFYATKNPKVGARARSREPADNQNRSSGDDRRESSPQSDSSDPRPQTSSQSKSSEDTNGSSADAQASLRQAADTSTAPHNNRSAKRVKSLPDDQKDEAYWERRRKNNEAAKRSRDTRRKKEDYIAMRAKFLEDENKSLRLSVAWLKQQLDTIKCCAAHNHNRF